MMTELNLFKEFAICSIDELRDEKIRIGMEMGRNRNRLPGSGRKLECESEKTFSVASLMFT